MHSFVFILQISSNQFNPKYTNPHDRRNFHLTASFLFIKFNPSEPAAKNKQNRKWKH